MKWEGDELFFNFLKGAAVVNSHGDLCGCLSASDLKVRNYFGN